MYEVKTEVKTADESNLYLAVKQIREKDGKRYLDALESRNITPKWICDKVITQKKGLSCNQAKQKYLTFGEFYQGYTFNQEMWNIHQHVSSSLGKSKELYHYLNQNNCEQAHDGNYVNCKVVGHVISIYDLPEGVGDICGDANF